ncbi:hypothetical protein ASE63_08195 [Bosea sp. Root381]|uniref:glycosyltransferase family A protein n=1 Tax=Bosea sp. Root381 TaxID=1736524 RepID=UPI0006F2C523|nr:glycosyltransferase family A protein [Bosea sp. Root381]KRE00073.1 hypothetical protein ASE63_08195 [Bosea sp. Root381]
MLNGVTIGLPAFNARRTLERAIDSALSQTIKLPFEIIVVDDGSDDTTANIALSYQLMHPDIVRLIRVPNGGVAAARNVIVANARFDHLTWLDADDYYRPDKLDRQYQYLLVWHMINKTYPGDTYLMTFAPVWIDRKRYDFSKYFKDPIKHILTGEFRAYLWASMTATASYREVGPFNEALHRSEDTDWLLRYLLSSERMLVSTDADEPAVQYHFSTQRDGKKVEESFDFMRNTYGHEMQSRGIFDEYVPRRYWEISNFYHSNKRWDDMWRCRALAAKFGPADFTDRLANEIASITDTGHRAEIERLVARHLD